MGLAKIVQKVPSEAVGGLAVVHHGLQAPGVPRLNLRPFLWGEVLVLSRLLQEKLGSGHIPRPVEEDALCRLPVPARPAGLLIIGL